MKRLILVGKAASGKDYMRDYLHNIGLNLEVSYTTRPPRTGERDGYTYNFVDEHSFMNLLHGGNMFESVEFAGKWYGTSMENWDTKDVFIFTPSGIGQIPEDERKDCLIIYFDMPYEIRKERLRERSDWDSVARRLDADEKDFRNFEDYDFVVIDPQYNPLEVFIMAITLGFRPNLSKHDEI